MLDAECSRELGRTVWAEAAESADEEEESEGGWSSARSDDGPSGILLWEIWLGGGRCGMSLTLFRKRSDMMNVWRC